MALRRDCSTCAHEDLRSMDEPCRSCITAATDDGIPYKQNWEPKDDIISKVESRFSPTIGGTFTHTREVVGMGELNKGEPKVIDVPGVVIKLELDDESCMSVANAICNYCVNRMGDDETAIIFMEELTEHIDSAVRAKKRWLEYQKSKEE